MSRTAPALALGEERPSPEDEEYARRFVQMLEAKLEREYAPGETLRDFHPKMHGCLRAEFEVLADAPADLRVGLFAEPATYPAWIRLSNGGPTIRSDSRPDLRGFAIKLMGVPGEKLLPAAHAAGTHDFLLASHVFFGIRTVKEFYGIQSALDRGPLHLAAFVLNPLAPHVRTMWMLMQAVQRCANLLETGYWSVTPYALGKRAVKYAVAPRRAATSRVPRREGPDYLRERLVADLADAGAEFDFRVQVQTDPVAMPVEDPSIVWDERRSPYRTVARIHVPAQAFDTPERRDFGENLCFNPWHAIEAHRPLGGANLARRIIYSHMSRWWHERNGTTIFEPTPEDVA